MIIINSVSIYPNVISIGGQIKIAVRVSDVTWENIYNTYSSWETLKDNYITWQAVKEDNTKQTSWSKVSQSTDWKRILRTYYDWFNVKDNIK